MADTPPTMVSSWVDLSSEVGRSTPPITTTGGHWCTLRSGPSTPPHPLGSSDYLRLLREAQSVGSSLRTSPLTSALATRCSTCRNTPGTTSPKSPPNSPNVELSDGESVEVFYVNRGVEGLGREVIEDFLWDWSSLPTSTPPKWTRGRSEPKPKKEDKGYSGSSMASILLSNLFSLLLGAGLGVWIYRRTIGSARGLQVLLG